MAESLQILSDKILSDIIVFSKYSRWIPELKRRETWDEVVERNKAMHLKKFPFLKDELDWVYEYVKQKKVLPSMRSLQFAGEAIEKMNQRMFNCSYTLIDSIESFSEIMNLLMAGCGVGYSVQKRHINLLPDLNPNNDAEYYLIEDSIDGWSKAVYRLVAYYYGLNPKPLFDYSAIRPKGTRLKTSGGKAPGPDQLRNSLNEIDKLMQRSVDLKRQKLSSLEVHDIICHIADAVVSGGIRRSACIVLFDKNDQEMMDCKSSSIGIKSYSIIKNIEKCSETITTELIPINKGFIGKVVDKIRSIFSKSFKEVNTKTLTEWEDTTKEYRYLSITTKDDKNYWLSIKSVKKGGKITDTVEGNCKSLFTKYNFDLLDIGEGKSNTIEWYKLEPQRARANNSVILLRGSVTEQEFKELLYKTRDSKAGEPGIYWTNDLELGTNPCLTEDSILITKNGVRKLRDVNLGDRIWTSEGWSTVTAKWKTGVKPAYTVSSLYGNLPCTLNHYIVEKGIKKQVRDSDSIDSFTFTSPELYDNFEPFEIKDYEDKIIAGVSASEPEVCAFLSGFSIANAKLSEVYDHRYVAVPKSKVNNACNFNLEYISEDCNILYLKKEDKYIMDNKKILSLEELINFENNGTLPEDKVYKLGFKRLRYWLAGYLCNSLDFTSEGAQVYFTHQKTMLEIQVLLSSLNIRAKSFKNGQLYGLKITDSLPYLYHLYKDFTFCFLDQLKNHEKLQNLETSKLQSFKTSATIDSSITEQIPLGNVEVWDITVDNKSHTFWCGGLNISNCVEIGLNPDQFCNLSIINTSNIHSQEDLNERVQAATFLGTLQASYTDNFEGLNPNWKETTDREALLGISLSGMASGVIDQYNATEAVELAKLKNLEIAKRIGINPAARITCIKPDGNSALVLGVGSGIHALHAPFYLRRVRLNKEESVYKYLVSEIPELVEDCQFAPETTGILTIPIKSPEGSIFRDEGAINFLERVKKYYKEWILPGHISGANTHNISCTVNVQDEEWNEVIEWMWKDRDYYAGISLLPYDGHTYVQAPLEECTEEVYNSLVKYCKKIDLSQIIEEADVTDHLGEVACAGGSCEITSI